MAGIIEDLIGGLSEEALGYFNGMAAGETARANAAVATGQRIAPAVFTRKKTKPVLAGANGVNRITDNAESIPAIDNGYRAISDSVQFQPETIGDVINNAVNAFKAMGPAGIVNAQAKVAPAVGKELIPGELADYYDEFANKSNEFIYGRPMIDRIANPDPVVRDDYGAGHDVSSVVASASSPQFAQDWSDQNTAFNNAYSDVFNNLPVGPVAKPPVEQVVSNMDEPADIPEKAFFRRVLSETVKPAIGAGMWATENIPGMEYIWGDPSNYHNAYKAVEGFASHPAAYDTEWGAEVGEHAGNIGSSAAQMGIAALLPGNPEVNMGIMAGLGNYAENRSKGVDPLLANIAAAANGYLETKLEQAGGGLFAGPKSAGELFGALRRGAVGDVLQSAKSGAKGLAKEVGTELPTSWGQNYLDVVVDPSHQKSDVRKVTDDTIIDTLGLSAGLGAPVAVANTANTISVNKARARQQQAMDDMRNQFNNQGFPMNQGEMQDVISALNRQNMPPAEQAAKENPTANASELGKRSLDILKQRKREDATVRKVNERANANVLNTGNQFVGQNVADATLPDNAGNNVLMDYVNAVKNARIYTTPTGDGSGPELTAEENSGNAPEMPDGAVRIDGRVFNVPGRKGVTVDHINERIKDNEALQASTVVQSVTDLPQNIQDEINEGLKAQGMEGRTDLVEGFVGSDGNSYIIGDNLTPERVEDVARHETIGHYGLQGMMEETEAGSYERLMNDISSAIESNKTLQNLRDEVLKSQPNITGMKLAEEIAAKMAEKNMQNSFTQRIFGAIRRFLKKMRLIKGDVTDAQLSKYLRDSQKWLANNSAIKSGPMIGRKANMQKMQPAFSQSVENSASTERSDNTGSFSISNSKKTKANGLEFMRHVDDMISGKGGIASLGMPDKVLVDAGISNREMRVTSDVVGKLNEKHGLSVANIKRLPDLLRRPVMIFKSSTDGGHVVVLDAVGKSDANKIEPIVAAIRPNGKVTFNYLKSAYARSNFARKAEEWINKGLLISAQKETAKDLFNLYSQWDTPATGQKIDSSQVKSIPRNAGKESRQLKVAGEYSEIAKKYEGTDGWLKAPNGNESNLNKHQWITVRTDAFKNWFGDWENDPENSSKVLDENGEPLIVYHGTTSGGHEVFDVSKANAEPAIWFSADKETAADYSKTDFDEETLEDFDKPRTTRESKVYEAFLNIRNPAVIDANGKRYSELNGVYKAVNDEEGNDGVIINNVVDPKFNATELNPTTTFAVRDPNSIKSATGNIGTFSKKNNNINFSLSETKKENEGRVLNREPGSFTAREQEVFDDFMSKRADADRINENLKKYAGTGWAKQAIEAVFVRQAMNDLMNGIEPDYESSMDSPNVSGMRKHLLEGGLEALKNRAIKNGLIGNASKPINNVNSSFLNCNPSKACAQYCYATKGNYRYSNVIVKSEMVTMLVEMDPEWTAKQVADQYKVTREFHEDKALRLYDKGDGDAAWIPFIKELNKQDIRVQIFSKRADFLRQVPEMNLRLLSIDESNMELADQNPDLPVAFVYAGEEQIETLSKLADREQIGVVLPVKVGRSVLHKEKVDALKEAVPAVKEFLCPIDAGYKSIGKTGTKNKEGKSNWNCTMCDKAGGVGCYHGRVTKAVMDARAKVDASLQSADTPAELKAMQAQVLREALELKGMLDAYYSRINQQESGNTSGELETDERARRDDGGLGARISDELGDKLQWLLRSIDNGTVDAAVGVAGRQTEEVRGVRGRGVQERVDDTTGRRVIPLKLVGDNEGSNQRSDKGRGNRIKGNFSLLQDGKIVRNGLNRNSDSTGVRVVEPTIDIPEFKRIADLSKWLKTALTEVDGTVEIESTGQIARFSKGNIGKSLKRARSEEHRKAYGAIKDLVRSAEYDHFEPTDERHPNLGGQDVYLAALNIPGKDSGALYAVQIKLDVPSEAENNARANEDGKEDVRYKDHRLKEIVPTLLSRSDQNGVPSQTAGTNEVSLGVLRNTVNTGNFSLAQDQGGFFVPDITVADNIIRSLQDQDVDIKRVQDAILRAGGAITDESDVYLNKTLYISKVADRLERMNKEFTDPILTLINESKVSYDEASDWLYARHVYLDDVNNQLASINEGATIDDALSGMEQGEAESLYKKHSGNKKLQEMADLVDKLMRRNVNILVNSGLLTPEEANSWSKKKHYVPLFRDNLGIRSETAMERAKKWWKARGNPFKVKAERNGPTGGTPKAGGVETRGKESRRRMGSKTRATNILGNVFASATAGIMRSQKQETAHAVLQMAKDNPNPDFWTVDKPETVKRINKQTGFVEVTYRDANLQPANHVFVVKVDGVEHWIVFNKDNARAMEMCKALKASDAPQLMWITQAVGELTRWTGGWLTTHNPVFALFNFMRDQQHMLFNLEDTPLKGKQLQVMRNLPGAMKGVWEVTRGDKMNSKWAKYFDEFKRNGAETGFINNFSNINDRVADLKKRQKELARSNANPMKWWSSFMDLVDDYNGITENGTRLAVYITARENGLSEKQAARIAKEITVDFNRKGQRSSMLNSVYMFTNANIQGHARMFRAMKNSKRARWIAVAMMGIGAGLAYVSRMLMGRDPETDEDKYDEISDFEKTTNWIFPIDTKGNYIKIPIAQGLHVLPSIGRIAMDTIISLINDNSKDAKQKAMSVVHKLMAMVYVTADAFNPLGSAGSPIQLATPSVFRPAVQIYENKSFTGAPLRRDDAPYNGYNAPAYQKAFKKTQEHWVNASKLLNDLTGGDDVKPGKLNVAPETLRLLFSSVFMPGMSANIDRALGSIERSQKGRDVRPDEMPVLNRVYGKAPNENLQESKYHERMNEMSQKSEQAKQYYKKYKDFLKKANKQAEDFPETIPELKAQLEKHKERYTEALKEMGDGNAKLGAARIMMMDKLGKKVSELRRKSTIAERDGHQDEANKLDDERMKVMKNFIKGGNNTDKLLAWYDRITQK